MHNITSISEFLIEAHTEYRIFDMGRTIRQIDAQVFLELENGTSAAPFPRQQMLWCGIVFWNKNLSEQRYIWFLKLPLDEQGCVVAAHRDQFLHIILDALGKEFIEEHKGAELPDNPYQFTPPQQQMADFNAIAKHLLALPANSEALQAREYLLAPNGDGWQILSVQSISDSCCNLDTTLCNALSEHWQHYPVEVLRPVSAALENQCLPEHLRANLTAKMKKMDNCSESGILTLRAISRDNEDNQLKSYVNHLLSSVETVPQDMLVVLAGRYWHWCQSEQFTLIFLDACAKAGCFAALYPDLVQIPSIRTQLLSVLRNPKRSEALSKAIGGLF